MSTAFAKLSDSNKVTVSKEQTLEEFLHDNKLDGQLEKVALYNWATKVPREINRALVELVGCKKTEADPLKSVLDPTRGTKKAIWKPEAWTAKDLALEKTHTIKVKKRLPVPGIAITKLTRWFIPKTGKCEVEYVLGGVTARADKVDFEAHATSYHELGKGGQEKPCDTVKAEATSTHVIRFEKVLEVKDATPPSAAQTVKDSKGNEWKGESEATQGVLEKKGSTDTYIHFGCAPYTVLLRYYKDVADAKTKIALGTFYPSWKEDGSLIDASLVVKWDLVGDGAKKLKVGQLAVWDKDDKPVFQVGLDERTLQTDKKYDLLNGPAKWAKSEIKPENMPYRVQIQAHSDEAEENGLAIAVMPTEVRAFRYEKAQFVAFVVKPGTKNNGTQYLGDADDDVDWKKRCAIMKDAIDTARQHTGIDASEETLKIFMAPEFFYRGENGAYPIEKVTDIALSMKEETDKFDYADWLFVLGTAIGYMPHEVKDSSGNLTGSRLGYGGWGKHNVKIKPVLGTDPSEIEVEYKGAPYLYWGASQESMDWIAVAAATSNPDEYTLTLQGKEGFAKGPARLWDPSDNQHDVEILDVDDSGTATKIKLKSTAAAPQKDWRLRVVHFEDDIVSGTMPSADHFKFKMRNKLDWKAGKGYLYEPIVWIDAVKSGTPQWLDIRSRLGARMALGNKLAGMGIRWIIGQPGKSAEIDFCKLKTAPDLYEVRLVTPNSFAPGFATLYEPLSTEVFNIALVQKGWPAQYGRKSDMKRALIYKEYVSAIDFIGKNSKNVNAWFDVAGIGRLIEIHGESDRFVLPTSGSIDLLAATPNVGAGRKWKHPETGVEHTIGSEINRSGDGGGSVVTIDGVTFGIEVCLDHMKNKLHEFYAGTNKWAETGDPKPQILLIPSWGMSIGKGKVVCAGTTTKRGLAFNVDGSRCDCDARELDGKFACPDHPTTLFTTGGSCAVITDWWVCTPCNSLQIGNGPCPKCKKTILVQYYECEVCKYKPMASPCSHGLTKRKKCDKALQPIGSPLTKVGATPGVASSDDADYFMIKGKIVVYPSKDIPDPEAVT